MSSLATPAKSEFVLPEPLHARLLPHQRDGVRWLYTRHCKSRACLLADEMGLGKTVQVAAFLGELYRRKQIKTTIIIVPPTLLPMWEAALVDWSATGSAMQKLIEVIHNDSRAKRQARWRKLKYGVPCILLTTYGVLRQDSTDMSAALVDYMVLDEAHLIRDAKTCAFKSALTLSARHKIALSGTPLMNSFDDMWSLFRFLDGSILTSTKADFRTISATLLRGNEKDATATQRAAAAAELSKLQAAIRPFMLRREKKDLVDAVASSKRDVVVWVRLSVVQQQQYEAFLESKQMTGVAGPQEGGGGDFSSGASTNSLMLLTMLSQICNHPWLNLLDGAFDAAAVQPYVAPLPEMGDVFAGAKLWVALQLLVRCTRQGRKSLVFSRSKRLLRLLSCLLKDWRVPHVQVDGDTASEQRFVEVQRFNDASDVWVCLLTTQVGGVGLTFTAASAVVLLDPSWNPSADAQAVDRVHRIGQARDVTVFRLVTCGTVEEKVYRNQIFKRMAALQSMCAGQRSIGAGVDDAVSEGKAASMKSDAAPRDVDSSELHRYFTRLQLRSMFVMDDVDHSSTAEQLAALHPHRVDAALRSELMGIDGVCDVSDNTCVLMEQVNDAQVATEMEVSLLHTPSPIQDGEEVTPEVKAGFSRGSASHQHQHQQQKERVRGRSESLSSSMPAVSFSETQLPPPLPCPKPPLRRPHVEETVHRNFHTGVSEWSAGSGESGVDVVNDDDDAESCVSHVREGGLIARPHRRSASLTSSPPTSVITTPSLVSAAAHRSHPQPTPSQALPLSLMEPCVKPSTTYADDGASLDIDVADWSALLSGVGLAGDVSAEDFSSSRWCNRPAFSVSTTTTAPSPLHEPSSPLQRESQPVAAAEPSRGEVGGRPPLLDQQRMVSAGGNTATENGEEMDDEGSVSSAEFASCRSSW
jgi:hypothetical protein